MFEEFLARLLVQCEEATPHRVLVWNRHDEQFQCWETRDHHATLRRLGTKEEACMKLLDCESALFIAGKACIPLTDEIERIRAELEYFPDGCEVGNPSEVHGIFGGCLRIGYTIEYDITTGLRKDAFELRDGALLLLTTSTEIWVSYCAIVRQESNARKDFF